MDKFPYKDFPYEEAKTVMKWLDANNASWNAPAELLGVNDEWMFNASSLLHLFILAIDNMNSGK